MRPLSYILSIFTILFTVISPAVGQWQVVKQLGAKSFRQMNVDVPPSTEKRVPMIMSASFINDSKGWAACDDGTLLKTTDGGTSWKESEISPAVNKSLSLLGIHSISVSFTSESVGWIVAEHKSKSVILKSADGGNRWKVIYTLQGRGSFHSIWFLNESIGWAVGEFEDGNPYKHGGLILGTENGGKTWRVQYREDGDESFLHELRFIDPQTGWAVGDGVILYTGNGGKTWTSQVKGEIDGELFGVDVLSKDDVWAVGSRCILHTLDAGKTWRDVKLPTQFEETYLNSVKFVDKENGWIAGNKGVVYSTTNGGLSWRIDTKDMSIYLGFLTTTNQAVFAFGNDGKILRRKL
jgi:photosystem II stability/assembly factor-like uncharacterized protein